MTKIKSLTVALAIVSSAALSSLVICSSRPNEENEGREAATPLIVSQDVKAVRPPASVTFANEYVPLQYFDVYESLSREMTSIVYSHGTLANTIRLANRYFPVIERILKEQGIPDDFKYICVAESNLQNVISPAQAVGYWQFLSGTAKEFGLEVGDEVDERYHIEKSTRAACKYFAKAYVKYDSWSLAAASYNVGINHIDGQIARQKSKNYYDMSLNTETARYLYRAIAYKLVLSKPQDYGFNIASSDLYPPFEYDELEVKTSIPDIADFANRNGTNYKLIKIFNPWLRSSSLANVAKKTYAIKIPKAGFRERAGR